MGGNMKPIEFTLAPTLVIETPQNLEGLVFDLVGNNNMVQHLKFNSLNEVSAYRIQKAHLEREDKVYLFNKETLELAYIPKVGGRSPDLFYLAPRVSQFSKLSKPIQ